MTFEPPEAFNIADYFLEDRLREGHGERVAIRTAERNWTYAEVASLARRYGAALREAGVRQEERVIVSVADGPDYVGALFGILEIGAVVVMVNPYLSADEIGYFLRYTRARAAIVCDAAAAKFVEARPGGGGHLHALLKLGDPLEGCQPLDVSGYSDEHAPAETHRDDPAIWLFSGGTTGKPKAVVQTHTAFANTTELYAKGVLGMTAEDITLAVPKLFFGYATGSNLLFSFAVGGSCVLFPERSTPEEVYSQIERHKPTILINVPTMIGQMLAHDPDGQRDLSSLRFATSAGEALPVALHEGWKAAYGTELLDGLGTAEQWHIFISNKPGEVAPGTLGKVVPGFEVKLCDPEGNEVPDGEIGELWVGGNSRALGYHQQHARSQRAFRGQWYVSGDQLRKDADGNYVYCGRADDMLKIKGKWFAPKEVEDCLARHDAVAEVAVIGVAASDGLTRPMAVVRPAEGAGDDLTQALRDHCEASLASYKVPHRFVIEHDLPRTHLGKINRGALRQQLETPEQQA